MNLISRVFIITICIFTADALPNLGNVTLVEKSTPRAIVNPPAINIGYIQSSCFAIHNNRMNQINYQTMNQTQECYEIANSAMVKYNDYFNQTFTANAHAQSRNIQDRLASCSTKTTNEATLNCYLTTFDQNMGTLYNLTVLTKIAAATLSGFKYSVDVERRTCVGKVLIGNKNNSTIVSNDLQNCLSSSTSLTNAENRTMIQYLR